MMSTTATSVAPTHNLRSYSATTKSWIKSLMVMLLGANGMVIKSLVKLTSMVKTTSSATTLATLVSDACDRVAAATAAAIALAVGI